MFSKLRRDRKANQQVQAEEKAGKIDVGRGQMHRAVLVDVAQILQEEGRGQLLEVTEGHGQSTFANENGWRSQVETLEFLSNFITKKKILFAVSSPLHFWCLAYFELYGGKYLLETVHKIFITIITNVSLQKVLSVSQFSCSFFLQCCK